MALTASYFDVWAEAPFKPVHDFDTHTFKAILTNVQPVGATDLVAGDLTEISPGNGYVAGGATLDNVQVVRSGGICRAIIDDETIAASGGNIGPFQWAVMVNASAPGQPLICMIDYGAPQTITDGSTFTLDFSQVNGLLEHEVNV